MVRLGTGQASTTRRTVITTLHSGQARPGPTAYNQGCRCLECTELHRLRQIEARAAMAARPREDVPHGTAGGYRNWGCRCGPCTKANTDVLREWRHSRRETAGD